MLIRVCNIYFFSATYTKDNGESFVLENGATLTEEGIYVVKVVDEDGNIVGLF